MMVLGIDPGASNSGYCFYDGNKIVTGKLPDTIIETIQLIRLYEPSHTFVEKVNPSTRMKPSDAGNMMRCIGQFEGMLSALDMQYTLVQPAVWRINAGAMMPEIDIYDSTSKRRTKIKTAMLKRARELFPDAPIKLAKDIDIAEAMLIAYACYQVKKI